jgi:hypothetical protein
MSLTLLTNTYANEFSGNSIYARFNTTNYINTVGVKSKWTVVFSAAPGTGNSFGFSSNKLQITFVFLPGTGTGIQHNIPVPSGTWNNAMMQTVASAMNAFADFALYYIASAVGTDIVIEAKEEGDDYSMFSRGVSGVSSGTYIAGVTEVLEENYKIVVIVKNYNTGAIIANLSINQIDGYAEVDLKEILHTLRNWSFEHDANFVVVPWFDNFTRDYVLQYTDSFGVPPVQQTLQTSGFLFVCPAKADSAYFNRQTAPAPTFANFFNFAGVLQAIVSIAPRVNRRIDLTKNDYLLYYNSGNVYKVEFTAKYANNTTVSTSFTSGSTVQDFFRVTVNFGKLSALPNQDDIIGFDVVFLDASNNVVSGVINYEVDRDNYPDKRNYVFQNKYWGVDTLLCTGVVSDNASFEKDIVVGSGQYPLDKKFYTRINKVSTTKTFVQNTGWLNKDEILVFEEMLRSEHVYVWDAELEDYKKIVISTDKVQLKESQRGMNAYEFEYAEEASS